MHRSNNSLMAGDSTLDVGGTNAPGRRPSRANATPDRPTWLGRGFLVPVMIICAALWFLLDVGRV